MSIIETENEKSDLQTDNQLITYNYSSFEK